MVPAVHFQRNFVRFLCAGAGDNEELSEVSVIPTIPHSGHAPLLIGEQDKDFVRGWSIWWPTQCAIRIMRWKFLFPHQACSRLICKGAPRSGVAQWYSTGLARRRPGFEHDSVLGVFIYCFLFFIFGVIVQQTTKVCCDLCCDLIMAFAVIQGDTCASLLRVESDGDIPSLVRTSTTWKMLVSVKLLYTPAFFVMGTVLWTMGNYVREIFSSFSWDQYTA